MPDQKKEKNNKLIDWNPRKDPDKKKPSKGPSFDRPRQHDFSTVAWEFKDFWYQIDPMKEVKYWTQKKK